MVEEYCLVAGKGVKELSEVKRVCGHPQIMDACSIFLNTLSNGDEVLVLVLVTTTQATND
jgi:prephenate dehydratase